MLYFVSKPGNDLLVTAEQSNFKFKTTFLLEAALEYAKEGDGILVLADPYLKEGIEVTEKNLDLAKAKGVRLYLEYPAFLL